MTPQTSVDSGRKTTLDSLPDEILASVFRYLGIASMFRMRLNRRLEGFFRTLGVDGLHSLSYEQAEVHPFLSQYTTLSTRCFVDAEGARWGPYAWAVRTYKGNMSETSQLWNGNLHGTCVARRISVRSFTETRSEWNRGTPGTLVTKRNGTIVRFSNWKKGGTTWAMSADRTGAVTFLSCDIAFGRWDWTGSQSSYVFGNLKVKVDWSGPETTIVPWLLDLKEAPGTGHAYRDLRLTADPQGTSGPAHVRKVLPEGTLTVFRDEKEIGVTLTHGGCVLLEVSATFDRLTTAVIMTRDRENTWTTTSYDLVRYD